MKSALFLLAIIVLWTPIQAQNILIYTHNGEGYVHDNVEASTQALLGIGESNFYTMQVSDDPDFFKPENLSKLDLVIFNNTNNEAFYTDAQRKAFKEFIEKGGSFVGVHISTGSEREWPWFWEMQGGKFRSHPAYQAFDIKVINPQHPATAFLPDIWKWEDECYYFDHLNPAITILLAADLRTIEDPQKDTYPGSIFGNYTPLSWYHHFGKARVFYTALGHKSEHYSDATFLKHLTEGIKWTLSK
ncbi:ThuA domain-containing protein [Mongoliibacter ruber]|uniref:Type 1 glutamine amidotransferase n=1 Tax=Mongoliibacter ruber TaxID=1750599 RepID=A0A2T0WF29_9BACT|nr:ThuA domain-containing protein [Mongoliibacter ruber]PRY85134.1 type 1 glutamine amidotransferase [Mongoliibacter ruber]